MFPKLHGAFRPRSGLPAFRRGLWQSGGAQAGLWLGLAGLGLGFIGSESPGVELCSFGILGWWVLGLLRSHG